ncbi:hypothetical protein OG906_00475 [Streptomyces sp. NBC_01426]|uniref:hypothetical protein n=1 Tax=Streptomyces sp. NBC_01426 TaxID=2975866 RepID=UPI002E371786|nr:hypothetical protein [Streptomyces sp. NBC_01426]
MSTTEVRHGSGAPGLRPGAALLKPPLTTPSAILRPGRTTGALSPARDVAAVKQPRWTLEAAAVEMAAHHSPHRLPTPSHRP